MGAHRGHLAPRMRERRPVDPSGASLCQLASDEGKHSNPKTERQAFEDFEIYSNLRLAEVDNPTIRFDRGRTRQVEWAWGKFYRSFQRLCATERLGAAQ